MIIDLKTVIPSVVILWGLLKKWYNEAAKILEPIVVEVEQRAKDGLIDKADRKAIAMKVISELEAQGKIQKLNFITKIIISKVVDKLASKLPDYQISKDVKDICAKS